MPTPRQSHHDEHITALFIFVVQIQRVQNYRQYTWQIIPKTGNSANFGIISFPMIFLCKVSEMGSI